MYSTIIGECWTYKSGLRICSGAQSATFGHLKWALLAKVPTFGYKKIVLLVPKLKNEDHIYKHNIPQKCWIRHLLSEIIISKQDFYNFIF